MNTYLSKVVRSFVLLALLCSAGVPLAETEVETTRELNGTNITYVYTSGRSYNVKFEEAGISYRYLSGSKPAAWWGPFPYQAIRIEDGLYFASWFEEGFGDYVTLLLNLTEKKLYGSAILRGEEVHFHSAEIILFDK